MTLAIAAHGVGRRYGSLVALEDLSLAVHKGEVLGVLPLAVAGSIPGHEIEHPMAIVILGGLVTSTLLNLLVVPVLYLRFAHRRPALAGR